MKFGTSITWFLFVLIILTACSGSDDPGVRLTSLTCEYRTTPLGINSAEPRFAWVLESPERGIHQTAYRILVATTPDMLSRNRGDVWDSGRVSSADNINAVYNGVPLVSGTRYWWKVRVWEGNGRGSGWSEPSWFETGLYSAGDWKGIWIGDGKSAPERDEDFYLPDPAPIFRKDFTLTRPVKQARLYISGLGYYEAYLNGDKIGDHVLDPGWTAFAKRVYYVVHDITPMLRQGNNTAGIMLGNGWYNPLPLRLFGSVNLRNVLEVGRPKAIAQMVIEYEDGAMETIPTDETWKVSESPILRNNVYLGEVYDARREQLGWNIPGYDDTAWKSAVHVTPPPGKLEVQEQPPIKVTKRLTPVAITEPAPEVYIYDFGQNFAGWINLHVDGPAGTAVKLRYGERLFEDGTLDYITSVCCQIRSPGRGGPGAPDMAWQEDIYILKGGGDEVFSQKFGFHGFRFVEITGYPGEPTLDDLVGLRLNSDVDQAGMFSCSDNLINRIQNMVDWTFKSNMFSIESDCPGREKFGYGGDIVTAGEAFINNYDMTTFFAKSIRDFGDTEREGGGLAECAPDIGINQQGFGNATGPVGWTLAHPFMQEQLYTYYGNLRLIEEQYDITKRLVDFIHEKNPTLIIPQGIGDHNPIAPRPTPVTSTAFFYHHAKLLSLFADRLGKKEDAATYATLADGIRQAFVDTFVVAGTGEVRSFRFNQRTVEENGRRRRVRERIPGQGDNPSQITQIIGLWYDLLPESERTAAIGVLITDIMETNNGHLTTGIFSTKMLFDVMENLNRGDVAYTVAGQRTFPGWGYMLDNGGTTLWETWPIIDESQNHPMFGSVSEWFMQGLAGIKPDPQAYGYDRIIIKPQAVDELSWVAGSYRSIRGRIASSWRREMGRFFLDVTVPGNTTATVYVPVKDSGTVMENGMKPTDSPGVRFIGMKDNAAVYEVGSGTYSFSVE